MLIENKDGKLRDVHQQATEFVLMHFNHHPVMFGHPKILHKIYTGAKLIYPEMEYLCQPLEDEAGTYIYRGLLFKTV